MAVTEKWVVPPETSPGHYLRRLAFHRDTVANTKYLVSKIGIADPANRARSPRWTGSPTATAPASIWCRASS